MKRLRLGKIDYMQEIGESDWFGDVLAKLSIVPTRVDYDGGFGIYTLTGLSKHFDEVSEGDQIPEYTLKLKQVSRLKAPEYDGIERVVVGGGLLPWEKISSA